MTHEAIWKRARADLLIPTSRGETDLFLWEHSWRVARSAQRIAALLEVRQRNPDDHAVLAAALYHDAGWVVRCRAGETDRSEILLGASSEADWEEAARMLERSLTGVLSPDSLQRAARAVRTFQHRAADSVEAQVVAEAESLQAFGVLSLWPAIRRGMLEGKGVQSLLDTWQRKKEYHFWEARLSDSFRFDPVRELARRRLEKLERLMAELAEQHNATDIPEGASLPRGSEERRSDQR